MQHHPTDPIRGVVAPIFTPFEDDLSVATDLMIDHARRMLEEGCAALAPFGTTGEALSLTRDERVRALWALRDAGIDPARMIPGTGLCSYGQTAELSRACLDIGCAGVMVLPPFYYKDVTDDGLHDYYARLIAAIGEDARLYLYHIPRVSGVGLSIPLVRRLRADFPRQVLGIKDSSGDWENTRALLRIEGLRVYVSTETRMVEAMDLGATGCITATANLAAPPMIELLAAREAGNEEDAALLTRGIADTRAAVEETGFIEVPKGLLALRLKEPRWANVRPPLRRAVAAEARALRDRLRHLS